MLKIRNLLVNADGMETYIDADSKLQITFEDGNTLTGYIERVEYGTYPHIW